MDEFHLDIFPGDFGLPSLDRDSLFTLAYCRFAGIPIKVHHRTNLYFAPVPSLKVTSSGQTIVGATEIIDYFERHNYRTPDIIIPTNGDESSTAAAEKTKLDLWSYKMLIQKKLQPCLNYYWWYDDENYGEFLRAWYAKRLPFPTNFFIPHSMRKEAVAKLEAQFHTKVIEWDVKASHIETEVSNEARYCLNLLSEKLGTERRYFFGDRPNSFDALVFSYLALLLKVPTKKSIIQAHIQHLEPLRNYVDRVLKTYFSQDYSEQSSKSPFKTEGGDGDANIKWRDLIFSGIFAGLLMVFYAASSGILNLKSSEEEESFTGVVEESPNLPEQKQQQEEHRHE